MGDLFRSFLAKTYQAVHGATGEPEITVEQLRQLRETGEPVLLLDVREPWERDLASIEGALSIPLAELPDRVDELDPKRTIIVHCKVGGRSARAVAFLRRRGFKNVANLGGGIDAWAERIDPALPRY